MSDPKDDIDLKDLTKINVNEPNITNNDITDENFSTKEDENSLILSSNKKFKNRQTLNYSVNNNPITNKRNKEKEEAKLKIKNELSSIKEEKNEGNSIKKNESKKSNDEDDDDFYLLENNKKEKKVDEEIIINQIINKKFKNKNNKRKTYPKEKDKDIISKDSKKSSKRQIYSEFLDKEEQEEETENEFKSYIKTAHDDEDEYKIIYEFNKLPYKPKLLNIDLKVFDENSVFKCITECNFDKKEERFIFQLNFVYLSNENKLYQEKNNDETIMNYYLDPNRINIDDKNDENENNDDNNMDNKIKIKIVLKRFRINKGYETNVATESKIISKKDSFDKFQKMQFDEKEDIANYKTYHKVYYILIIQKYQFPKSRIPESIKKIGIKNEGSTCYMNSIIQSIYNNNFLLKNIMKININSGPLCREEKTKDKNIISALQTKFYDLYNSKNSIRILNIFTAFDWKRIFWNSPQDAEEIYIEIYQIISLYNEEIKNNCEGILINTIEVKEKDFKSQKEENFFFLQLDIEDNNSLEGCLDKFFKNEELTGDNKYQYIDEYGIKSLFDAKKYYKFKKIPNILFIQLKRFQYDPNTLSFIKNNKGISFKEEINLKNYIDSDNNKTKSKSKKKVINNKIYSLYCVIVHSGSSQSGHYFCFVKDFKNECYIKFNDTSVDRAERKEVFNHNFGGEEIEYAIKKIGRKKDNHEYEVKDNKKEIDKNAYIFIYVNKNKIDELFIDKNESIKTLFEEYQKNKKEENLKKKEKAKNRYTDEYRSEFIGGKNFNNEKNTYNKKGKNTTRKTAYIQNNQNINNNKKYENFNVNMKEETPDFSSILSEMNQFFASNIQNNNNFSKNAMNNNKRATYFSYNFENSSEINNKKITDYIGIKDIKTNFYLIDDISNKIKAELLIEYNTKIKVKDIPIKIREQFKKGRINNKYSQIFEKIVNSPGYKLAIVNAMGFFIKFLDDDEEYDMTHLLKSNDDSDKKNVNHLCLYNLPQYKDPKNIIAINFISNSLLDLIKSKSNNLYENCNFENINIPAFIINEEINDIKELNNRIKDIYINYFGKNAQKINKFRIYIFSDKDITNLDILKINFDDLTTEEKFSINFLIIPNVITKVNLLVGI